MFESFWKLIKSLVVFIVEFERYHKQLEETRKDMDDLATEMVKLKQEVRHNREMASAERELLLSKIENKLLQTQRALPPAP